MPRPQKAPADENHEMLPLKTLPKRSPDSEAVSETQIPKGNYGDVAGEGCEADHSCRYMAGMEAGMKFVAMAITGANFAKSNGLPDPPSWLRHPGDGDDGCTPEMLQHSELAAVPPPPLHPPPPAPPKRYPKAPMRFRPMQKRGLTGEPLQRAMHIQKRMFLKSFKVPFKMIAAVWRDEDGEIEQIDLTDNTFLI